MLMKAKGLNDRNLCDRFDQSNMSGNIAQAQLFEKVICY